MSDQPPTDPLEKNIAELKRTLEARRKRPQPSAVVGERWKREDAELEAQIAELEKSRKGKK